MYSPGVESHTNHVYQTSDGITIFVKRGYHSQFDFIVQYQLPGHKLRTPKLAHLATDLLIKRSSDENLTRQFLDYLATNVLPKLGAAVTFPPRLQIFHASQERQFRKIDIYGEYSVEFIMVVSELLGIQEKTNYPKGELVLNLFQGLRDGADIFWVDGTTRLSVPRKFNKPVATQGRSPAHNYDVALSFAGEDRPYVAEVANMLRQLGVRVFYDEYEEVDLWGKDLYSHLDKVYRKDAQFCVMFISRNYANKVWTNHERQSAQARALQESSYILIARFDDTDIPGVRETIAYVDLSKKDPIELAHLIARKLGPEFKIDELVSYLKHSLPEYDITIHGAYLIFHSSVQRVISENGEEDFEASYPIGVLLEMYRVDLLDEMFLLPQVIPHG